MQDRAIHWISRLHNNYRYKNPPAHYQPATYLQLLRQFTVHKSGEKVPVTTGRARITYRAPDTLWALMKDCKSWTTRPKRWAPETHSGHMGRGPTNAGHRRWRTLRFEVMRLASRWSWSAACRVCSRDMTRSHSPGARPSRLADSFRCPHPFKEWGVVKLYAKRAIHMGVFIVPIRCEPVGTTVVLSPDQRVVSRGFGAGSSTKWPSQIREGAKKGAGSGGGWGSQSR